MVELDAIACSDFLNLMFTYCERTFFILDAYVRKFMLILVCMIVKVYPCLYPWQGRTAVTESKQDI